MMKGNFKKVKNMWPLPLFKDCKQRRHSIQLNCCRLTRVLKIDKNVKKLKASPKSFV